ncbi:mediator of RNA polymerase II transcription subunit 4 [Diaphorina citri]|uniref:Mediator of RNA polymerase II transcription subunit 4 n=1 Tax=Diaphorina citri TaxID=121845 RepID=A0A3Q0J5E4_DIACI|nr:mediator of RNA polymerase II transcription subunit 4 [Diaphorina citri]
MSSKNISTGEKLLSLIDDIELVAKEMLENTIALKHQKLNGPEQLKEMKKQEAHNHATAIFQAKQKLQSINKANKRPVSSEELIKYAHRISSSNAVCAPLTWQPGDPRRPYPTDIEMRVGFLGRLNDSPLNGHLLPQQSLGDLHRTPSELSQQNQFSWHSGDMHIGNVPLDRQQQNSNRESEDVEVMSTDSSSSSSSDSQ